MRPFRSPTSSTLWSRIGRLLVFLTTNGPLIDADSPTSSGMLKPMGAAPIFESDPWLAEPQRGIIAIETRSASPRRFTARVRFLAGHAFDDALDDLEFRVDLLHVVVLLELIH